MQCLFEKVYISKTEHNKNKNHLLALNISKDIKMRSLLLLIFFIITHVTSIARCIVESFFFCYLTSDTCMSPVGIAYFQVDGNIFSYLASNLVLLIYLYVSKNQNYI